MYNPDKVRRSGGVTDRSVYGAIICTCVRSLVMCHDHTRDVVLCAQTWKVSGL
jgi:hypothetical protein